MKSKSFIDGTSRFIASALTLGIVKPQAVSPALFAVAFGILIAALSSIPVGLIPPEWANTELRLSLMAAIGVLAGVFRFVRP